MKKTVIFMLLIVSFNVMIVNGQEIDTKRMILTK